MEIDHTQIYSSLINLQCPCLLFGNYVWESICPWMQLGSQLTDPGEGFSFFHSRTNTHLNDSSHTVSFHINRVIYSQAQALLPLSLSLSLALSGLLFLCLAKKTSIEILPRIPCWASSSSIEISRLYLVILSAPFRPPSLT